MKALTTYLAKPKSDIGVLVIVMLAYAVFFHEWFTALITKVFRIELPAIFSLMSHQFISSIIITVTIITVKAHWVLSGFWDWWSFCTPSSHSFRFLNFHQHKIFHSRYNFWNISCSLSCFSHTCYHNFFIFLFFFFGFFFFLYA